MALENRLAQLQQLEVGDMERTIGDIARANLGIEISSDNHQVEAEIYRRILKEKLPRILENIQTLSAQIFCLELKRFPIDPSPPYFYLFTSKDNKNHYLNVEGHAPFHTIFHGDYGVEFSSKRDQGLIEGICLYEMNFDKKRNSERKGATIFHAETLGGFSERYAEIVISQFVTHGASHYMELPGVLNRVPQTIAQVYIKNKEEEERKLQETKSQNQKIESLEVSDII